MKQDVNQGKDRMTSMKRWIAGAVLAGWLTAAMMGCATEHTATSARPDWSVGNMPLRLTTTTAGYSVEDRAIEFHSFGSGSDCVLIIASIHGDEAAGTPLLEALAEHLSGHTELIRPDQRVILVPRVNPDGVARDSRTNMNGVDLNRNFPASNWRDSRANGTGPLSEPESRAIYALIDEVRPVRVISIHQPLRCIDYDGPAQALARAMAESCDLKVRKLGARPGSLGSYVGLELGIPIVTVELPGGASRWSRGKLWDRYGEMLLAAIRF